MNKAGSKLSLVVLESSPARCSADFTGHLFAQIPLKKNQHRAPTLFRQGGVEYRKVWNRSQGVAPSRPLQAGSRQRVNGRFWPFLAASCHIS
jgi:hypothetical protein